MIKLVGELKTRWPEMKARLAAARYTAEADGGAVRATVNGKLALLDVKIDRQLLATGAAGSEALEDLIKAAVANAQGQAVKAAEAAWKELTGGMEIPGLGEVV